MRTRNYRSLALLAPIAACVVAFAPVAQAAIVNITGGTTLLPTTDSGARNNNVLGAGYVLQDNASIATTVADVAFKFYYLGAESGFTNTLNTPWGVHADTNGPQPGIWPGLSLFSGVAATPLSNAQLLYFTTTGSGIGTINPGGGDAAKSIAFAYLNPNCIVGGSMVGQQGCASTTTETLDANGIGYILFALDDSGAGPDDNHDDYVGYMTYQVVPIPAAVWLLCSGLIGLVGLSRRRVLPSAATA